jgi:hypothetical protein
VRSKLDDTYSHIRIATYGIAFFGTPHQGGNNATLGKVMSNVARAVLRTPKNNFLEALQKDSTFADTLSQNFRHLLEDYYILSFYETREFKKLGLVSCRFSFLNHYLHLQVVNKKSATLGQSGIREKQIALDADHSHICKFENDGEDKYEQVADNLVKLIENAISAAKMRQRLENQPIKIEFSEDEKGEWLYQRNGIQRLNVYSLLAITCLSRDGNPLQ